MTEILDSEQMASIDRRAIDTYGIPSIVLMENAAIAVADAISDNYPEGQTALVVCGTGNNGGDGFAIARHLQQREWIVTTLLVGNEEKLSGDARTNYDICARLGLIAVQVASEEDVEEVVELGHDADLVVDAMFGTGLDRKIEGFRAELIDALNALDAPIVAVDLPSGLRGSSAEADGPAIEADLTVTFCRPKVPHVFPPASECCGTVVVADISIPDAAVEEEGVALALVTPLDIVGPFVVREAETHKGTFGHVALVAGSEGRTGAAILSARAAVRGGAGLVTVLTDRESAAIIDSVSIESMSKTIERSADRIDEILRVIGDKDAVLVGPGLPDDEESYSFIRALIERIEVPLLIDASALNAYEGKIESLRSDRTTIVTPHPGELGRLLGSSAKEVNADRIGNARDAASRAQAVVVLKGNQTLIASPDGRVAVNPTGNPGMASGGMGDVLGGLMLAVLARCDDPFEAACAAVFLHGLTADLVRDAASDTGLRAMELAEALPRGVAALREMV